MFQNMRAWLGIGYRPTWDGRHCFRYPLTLAQDVDECIRMIEVASKMVWQSAVATTTTTTTNAILTHSPCCLCAYGM
jgi:hypothetical protein